MHYLVRNGSRARVEVVYFKLALEVLKLEPAADAALFLTRWRSQIGRQAASAPGRLARGLDPTQRSSLVSSHWLQGTSTVHASSL